MFGRRNPDRPLDLPLPDGQEMEDLNLDLLDDLPDIVEPRTPSRPRVRRPLPCRRSSPPRRRAEPAWQPAPSILGPSVTRMLQTRADTPPTEEDAVPRTDLSSPPPRTPVPPVFQVPPPTPAAPFAQPAPIPAPPVAAAPLAPAVPAARRRRAAPPAPARSPRA